MISSFELLGALKSLIFPSHSLSTLSSTQSCMNGDGVFQENWLIRPAKLSGNISGEVVAMVSGFIVSHKAGSKYLWVNNFILVCRVLLMLAVPAAVAFFLHRSTWIWSLIALIEYIWCNFISLSKPNTVLPEALVESRIWSYQGNAGFLVLQQRFTP